MWKGKDCYYGSGIETSVYIKMVKVIPFQEDFDIKVLETKSIMLDMWYHAILCRYDGWANVDKKYMYILYIYNEPFCYSVLYIYVC